MRFGGLGDLGELWGLTIQYRGSIWSARLGWLSGYSVRFGGLGGLGGVWELEGLHGVPPLASPAVVRVHPKVFSKVESDAGVFPVRGPSEHSFRF